MLRKIENSLLSILSVLFLKHPLLPLFHSRSLFVLRRNVPTAVVDAFVCLSVSLRSSVCESTRAIGRRVSVGYFPTVLLSSLSLASKTIRQAPGYICRALSKETHIPYHLLMANSHRAPRENYYEDYFRPVVVRHKNETEREKEREIGRAV